MKKFLIQLGLIFLLAGSPLFAGGPELDENDNDAVDIVWGGTDAKTVSAAQENLQLKPGGHVQPYNANTDTNKNDDITTGAGEISGLTEKASPVDNDVVIVEDSAAGYAKKKVKISNLPAGGAGGGDMYKSTYDADDNGIIDPGALGTGTPDGTKYLRDDGTFQTIQDTGSEPASADPDIATAGVIGRDTNDHSLRGYDGADQYVYGQKKKPMTFTISEPLFLSEEDNLVLWVNRTGFSYVITGIYSYADIDNVDYTLREMTDMHNFTQGNVIEAIVVATDGTGVFYSEITSGIDDSVIEDGHAIAFDNGAAAPDSITIVIDGYLLGDVN